MFWSYVVFLTHSCLFSYHQLMLESWNVNIFSGISSKLKEWTMMLLKEERQGKAVDAQLIIGVRQSFG